MKISYAMTKELAGTGISRSLAHRYPLRRLLMPI
jgi:hypothetical protein